MQDTFIDTRNGRIAARCCGSAAAPVVLCLHGFPDDASTFDGLAGRLGEQGWRVVAPYLRGFAPSPTTGALDLPALVDDLFAVADAVSPSTPVA